MTLLAPNSSGRYRELDSLRGIAALMVVFFHLTMGRQEAASLGFDFGTMGVDLFFIISGFVISISIHSVSNGAEFVVNRASRLYPTYWTAVTFTFLLISLYGFFKNEPIRWIDYLGNMTMFQYYLGIKNLDDPYWTLIVEMNFYLFILLLFQTNFLRFIIPIGISITVCVGFLAKFFWTESIQLIFSGIPLLEFFPLFFAGIIFYKWKNDLARNFPFVLILLLCLITQITLFDIAGLSRVFLSQEGYAVVLTLFFILFSLLVKGRLIFFTNAPLLFLGRISFALYLVHQYFLLGHLLPLLVNRLHINFWVASVICALVAIAVAACITYFVEVPYSQRIKKWLSRRLLPG